MDFEKYQEIVYRYPLIALWLDVPTCPEAERYLTKNEAIAFRLDVARQFVESRVGHIAIKELAQDDFFDQAYDNIVTYTEDKKYVEVHMVVFYHFDGEQPFSKMFTPHDDNCTTLGEVHAAIEELRGDHGGFTIDACVRHTFRINPGRVHSIKMLINTGVSVGPEKIKILRMTLDQFFTRDRCMTIGLQYSSHMSRLKGMQWQRTTYPERYAPTVPKTLTISYLIQQGRQKLQDAYNDVGPGTLDVAAKLLADEGLTLTD